MANQIKFLSLDVFGANQQWIYDYIKREDAKSLKSVAISSDRKKLLFYRVESPTSSSVPAFEVEIPIPNLDSVIAKVNGAKENNIPLLTSAGAIKDSGISLDDLATEEEIERLVATEIAKKSHLSKQIVTVLPSSSDAKTDVIYLLKVSTATGKDVYEEYTLIGGELVCIGDTSTDLSNYYTKEDTDSRISGAKTEAINSATATAAADAQKKADAALASAKIYADEKIADVSARMTNVETRTADVESSVTTINGTLTKHADRISDVEETLEGFEVATEAEALQIFNSIFNK